MFGLRRTDYTPVWGSGEELPLLNRLPFLLKSLRIEKRVSSMAVVGGA